MIKITKGLALSEDDKKARMAPRLSVSIDLPPVVFTVEEIEAKMARLMIEIKGCLRSSEVGDVMIEASGRQVITSDSLFDCLEYEYQKKLMELSK